MALKIVETCIDCGACEPECPNQAIAAGDGIYVIDAERCTECVGAFDAQQCIEHCPVDECIVPDPERRETREELERRYARLHAA
jgi:ferredoxin